MDATNLNCNSNDSGSKTYSSSPQEKVLSSGIQLRTSARVSKKLRLDQEAAQAAVSESSSIKKEEVKEDNVSEKRRARRAPVLWSPEDQAAFFEALNEHGKNFYAIEKYMASRAKRRGEHSAKNREMSRHFYYRSWHKLSKYVHFPESINKVTQELYALINFGELRKKVGHITEKNAQKLNELIYSGSTQVRVKGKAWRVKTPVCRALRKLNHFEDDREEIRLPTRVEVLLTARTNKDAVRVQSVGHNPRVRTCLTLDTNTDYLASVLGRRWAAATTNPQEVLKIGSKKNAVPTQTTYTVGRVVTSSSVSLQSHEKRIGTASSQVDVLLSQLQVGKTKSALKWQQREGSGSDALLDSPVVDPSQITDNAGQFVEQTSGNHFIHHTGQHTTQLQATQQAPPSNNQEMTLAIATRIGHLYLLYGSKGVLELEYWWDKIKKEGQQPVDEKANAEIDCTKALKKLVSIAKFYHYKTKVECPCGHICKSSLKPSVGVQSKSSKQNKIPKKVEGTVPPVPLPVVKLDTPQLIPSTKASVPSSNQVRMSFKQPLLPAPLRTSSDPGSAAEDLRSALHHFRPKYCSRRGRARQRSVVVQRMLPLLPKSKQGPVIVTLQVLQTQNQSSTNSAPAAGGTLNVGITPGATSFVNMAQGLTTGTISKIQTGGSSSSASPSNAATISGQVPQTVSQDLVGEVKKEASEIVSLASGSFETQQKHSVVSSGQTSTTDSLQFTAPNLCQLAVVSGSEAVTNCTEEGASLSLLNIPFSQAITQQPQQQQQLQQQPAENIQLTSTFKGILGNEGNSGEMLDVTPPTSPSRLLKEGEGQWLSSEVTDFSLSSFLGHLESPIKTNGTSEDTHMSTDVESHFQSLMAENSLDYTAKFADLAAKIVGNNQTGSVSVPPP